jgi:hypothetical protein
MNSVASSATHPQDSSPSAISIRPVQDPLQAPPPDPVDNALGHIGILSLNAMGHSASSARGIADRVSCSSLVLEAIGLPGWTYSGVAPTKDHPSRLSSASVLFKTPVDLNYDVMQTAEAVDRFSHVTGTYLSVVPSFRCAEIFAGWDHARRAGTASSLLETEPETVLLSKLMLAIGFCAHSQDDSVDLLVSALTEDLANSITRLADLPLLRVLLLQILLALQHPLGGSAWSLLGLAMSRAVSLGLHRGTKHPSDVNTSELRGLFWVLYALDRTLALATDRPFALADSDSAVAEEFLRPRSSGIATVPDFHLLQSCAMHHAQLMSAIRRNRTEDGYFHLMNYYHWRDTYQRDALTEPDDSPDSLQSALFWKHGLQLRCRALVQLSVTMFSNATKCFSQLRHDILQTVADYIEHLGQLGTRHSISLTFVDGYEIFAAATIFVHVCLSRVRLSAHECPPTRLSIDNLKVIMAAMDLLLGIAKRFPSVKALRDVLWEFVTACEQSAVARNATSAEGRAIAPAHDLSSFTRAVEAASVPHNIALFMDQCLHQT